MKRVSQQNLATAVTTLEQGGILGVPTETVYGLAVKANDSTAIKKLLRLKNRQVGSGKILTMMLSDVNDIELYAQLNQTAQNLALRYFPGELTLVLPKRKGWRHPYFDHFDSVGIRIPQHNYMLELLRATGPLLVTSANPRGEAPCYDSRELARRLPEVDAIVGGRADGNLPSTILDLTTAEPQTLRQGGLLIIKY